MPTRDVPFVIRNLGGINRKDGADKVLDNQFFSLQNWIHTTKGLLYKRPGSAEDLTAADLFGASKITGIHRYYSPSRKRYTFYHCRPDATNFPQPTQDLVLSEIAGGDLFKGGAVETLRVCYTWVGLGMESNYNSLSRPGFVPVSVLSPVMAKDQVGHQSITVSNNTKGIRVTVPAFPSGVRSANIFAARGNFTQMTYVGSVNQSGGSLDIKGYIGLGAAYHDDVTANTISAIGLHDADGKLTQGSYYLGFAWVCSPGILEGQSYFSGSSTIAEVTQSKLVALDVQSNAIQVKCSHGESANFATHVYVLIGRRDRTDHPMVCVGIIKTDGSDTLIIREIPGNTNAQSQPHASVVMFNTAVPAGNAQNTNRAGFLLTKDQDGVLGEVLISRSETISLSAPNVDGIIRTDNDRMNYIQGTFPIMAQPTAELYAYYLEPSFVTFLGINYMVNGVNYMRAFDEFSGAMVPAGSNVNGPPIGNLILIFQNQLVTAGGALGNLVYASNAMQPKNWSAGGTGAAYRYMIIGDPQSDGVTGLALFSYTTGTAGPQSYLVAQKKSGTWVTSAFSDPASGVAAPLQQASGRVGSLSYRSYANTPSGLLFIGSDGEVYLLRGAGEPYRIGTSVKPILEHIAQSDTLARKITATYHGDFYKVSYPSGPTSTYNDAQLYADMRTGPGDPIVWSGPHIGPNVGPQIALVGEGDDGRRIACRSDGTLGTISLDDVSTYLDLGAPVVSVIDSKTYRFGAEMHLKRIMGMVLDAYYDSAYTHSLVLEAFGDEFYTRINKLLSTGGAVWDSDSYDIASKYSDAMFQAVPMMFGENLNCRTFRWRLTHSDNANIILASAAILYQPSRRQIV